MGLVVGVVCGTILLVAALVLWGFWGFFVTPVVLVLTACAITWIDHPSRGER